MCTSRCVLLAAATADAACCCRTSWRAFSCCSCICRATAHVQDQSVRVKGNIKGHWACSVRLHAVHACTGLTASKMQSGGCVPACMEDHTQTSNQHHACVRASGVASLLTLLGVGGGGAVAAQCGVGVHVAGAVASCVQQEGTSALQAAVLLATSDRRLQRILSGRAMLLSYPACLQDPMPMQILRPHNNSICTLLLQEAVRHLMTNNNSTTMTIRQGQRASCLLPFWQPSGYSGM